MRYFCVLQPKLIQRCRRLSKIVNIPGVVAVAGTSTRVVVWLEAAQESVGRATVAKHTPSLVAHSGYNEYPLAQSSQLSGRALAAQCTGADNDEESLVAGEHNSAVGQVVAGQRLPTQSLRRETQ